MELLNKNPYSRTGLGLLVAGVVVALPAHFLLALNWLTATGISMVTLAFIFLALGRTIPALSPETCDIILETGIDNVSAIIEELGVRRAAIYLPSSVAGGRPQALIPLNARAAVPPLEKALDRRLIVRYGSGPDDYGLLLSTVGSTAFKLLEATPGADVNELESALNALLAGALGIASGANVTMERNGMTVTVRHPRTDSKSGWCNRCLGSPLASIVASITAEAWNRPVTIEKEEALGDRYRVTLELPE